MIGLSKNLDKTLIVSVEMIVFKSEMVVASLIATRHTVHWPFLIGHT